MQVRLQIKNLSLCYEQQMLFKDFSADLAAQRWHILMGPSGVGKSSLLRCIAGLPMRATSFAGRISSPDHACPSEQVAYLTQIDDLLPWLNILDNVLLGFRLRRQAIPTALGDKAQHLLGEVGLGHSMHKKPKQLSGGMRARVKLVRTLIEDKAIVLLDEPFSALDALTRYQMQTLAHKLLRDKTVLMVTHDPQEALRLADDIMLLGGQPARLTRPIILPGNTPRELNDANSLALQQQLYQHLLAESAA